MKLWGTGQMITHNALSYTHNAHQSGLWGNWSTANSGRIHSQLREDLHSVDPGGSMTVHLESLEIHSELAADPLWVGCRSSLSWLLIDSLPSPPTDFNLSELAVNWSPLPSPASLPTDFNFSELAVVWPLLPTYRFQPLWVGCWFTPLPSPSPPSPPTDFNLCELAVNRPPHLPPPYRFQLSNL